VRILKLIGLAALAVIAVSLFAGVGSAAAAAETKLCKSGTWACTTENQYPAGTAVEATTPTRLKILNGAATIECSSTLKGSTGAAAGSPLPVNLSTWTFSNCNQGCSGELGSTKFKNVPSSSLSWKEGSNGEFELHEGTGRPTLEIYCPFIYEHCSYTFPNLTFKGGNPAQLVATQASMTRLTGAGECKSELHLEATFSLSAPNPAYLATTGFPEEAHLRICKEFGSVCPDAKTYAPETKLRAEATDFKLEHGLLTVTCGQASIETKSLALGAKPFPLGNVTFSASSCYRGGYPCEVTQANVATATFSEDSNGIWFSTPLRYRVYCPFTGIQKDCTYSLEYSPAQVRQETGSNDWVVEKATQLVVAGTECGNQMLLTAHFYVKSPTSSIGII
jgi:hypothetical protein